MRPPAEVLGAGPGGASSPLGEIYSAPISSDRFLTLALAATRALETVHRTSMHGDVRPANLTWRPESGQVELTGRLDLSAAMPDESALQSFPAESLPYMAPERTGRTAWVPDRRSDLYSLGVTFYQMLSGSLPFEGKDALEWAHCHIARPPRPLAESATETPEVIAGIVMKLLAKAPEERYQTAGGLLRDLARCRAALDVSGELEPFSLGAEDHSGELRMPRRLYGRASEQKKLREALARTSRDGAPELVLLSGPAGIGKTALLEELRPSILLAGGLLLSGKPDQFEPGVPYGTLARAMVTLAQRLLTEPAPRLAAWRRRILEAVGDGARIVNEVIPRMTLVLGDQPPLDPLPGPGARARFHMVFQRLFSAIADEEHPLVLFLDDLQWADPESIELLTHVLGHPDTRHLLVIGAYRDSEVEEDHPLASAEKELSEAGVDARHIPLGPLSVEDITQLLADALRTQDSRARDLAKLVHQRTAANPLFITQFLDALCGEGLIRFDADSSRWEWDAGRIKTAQFTDNVVELMVARLAQLPEETRAALELAACLGREFSCSVLARVVTRPQSETHELLRPAVEEGLVVQLGDTYVFLHDRVQQAAHLLIPVDELESVHLHIGRLLLDTTPEDELDQRIFLIANQLNLGAQSLDCPPEQRRYAEVNLRAGKKAKASSAFQVAANYLAAGAEMLGALGWGDHYDLMWALTAERAECENLSGNAAEAARLCELLRERSKTALEKHVAYRIEIEVHLGQADAARAVETCIECLALFGVELARAPTTADVESEIQAIWEALGDRGIEDLGSLPPMDAPEMRAVMEALSVASPAAWYFHEDLSHLMVARMVRLSILRGCADASAMGYATFGMVLIARNKDYRRGFQFGKLGHALSRRTGTAYWKGVVENIYGAMVAVWSLPLGECLNLVRESLDTTTRSGNLTFLSYNCSQIVMASIATGAPLDEVHREGQKLLETARAIKTPAAVRSIIGALQFVQAMRGLTRDLARFDGPEFDEATFEQELSEGDVPIATFYYYLCKLQAAVLSGDSSTAVAASMTAMRLAPAIGTQFPAAECRVYSALAHLLRHRDVTDERARQEHLETARRHAAPLDTWAEVCPHNFLHMHALVSAELARVEGRDLEAMKLYERAISAASEHGFTHREGLAAELASRFHLERGLETNAAAYIRRARACYTRWGAGGKVLDLERRHAALLAEPDGSEAGFSAQLDLFDVITAVKSAQAISSEIILDDLLATLLRIVIEHAGAQTGLLFVMEGEEPSLAATAAAGPSEVQIELGRCSREGPSSVINYVIRTKERLILDEPATLPAFSSDPILAEVRPKSMLCMPLIRHSALIGLLYLENALTRGAFTPQRLALLEVLAAQAAISLENARLYAEVARENTQRQRAEQDLRTLNAELEQRVDERTAQLRQLNDELEAFSYSVSHDLRAPLRIISRFSSVLDDEHRSELSEGAREHLARVRRAAARMGDLLEDMLGLWSVSRCEMRRERVDLSGLAREILADLSRSEPERSVTILIDEGLFAEGDARLLRIALENLLGNAWKFTSKHPKARIEFGSSAQPNAPLVYFIRDDGAGFDMRYSGKLFYPFQRIHEASEFAGTGVGLATVQRIIQRHSGRVWAEAAVEKGATFYFTL